MVKSYRLCNNPADIPLCYLLKDVKIAYEY